MSMLFQKMLGLILVVPLSYYEEKYQYYLPCGAILHRDVVFFWFPFKLSQVPAGYALCCLFVFPCLGVLGKVKSPFLYQTL